MPFKNLTDKEIESLKSEFDQLQTIEEKYNFWPRKLKTNYVSVGYTIPLQERGVNEFVIYPENEAEEEELNLLLLRESLHFNRISGEKNHLKSYEVLVSLFLNKIEGVVNFKPALIEELNWIDSEVKFYEELPSKPIALIDLHIYRVCLSACWLISYRDYYLKRSEVNYRVRPYTYPSILGMYGGCEVAKYREYIEERLEELNNKQVVQFQPKTPLKRQLLILEYSGMLEKLNHLQNKDRNKLLSILLNRSEQSIKQELTNLPKKSWTHKIRTPENFTFLFNQFNEVGLNEQAEVIKRELDKLKDEKK